MKKLINYAALMICLTVMFCGQIFSQQQQSQPQIVEPPALFEFHIRQQLRDGSFVVVIGGKEYRAITADQMRRALSDKAELESLRVEKPLLEKQLQKEKQLADNFKADLFKSELETEGEKTRAEKFRVMYERENALRLDAEKLKKPSKLERILSNPVIQTIVIVGAGVGGALVGKAL